MTKLELKSSHEVIEAVDVADVDSIFYCKPTDPDILTVLMKDGKRLYCDEVCPVDSLQEEPVSIDFEKELYKAFGQVKDFTLGMRIAKWFYDMGRKQQEYENKVWHDASKETPKHRGIIIANHGCIYYKAEYDEQCCLIRDTTRDNRTLDWKEIHEWCYYEDFVCKINPFIHTICDWTISKSSSHSNTIYNDEFHDVISDRLLNGTFKG